MRRVVALLACVMFASLAAAQEPVRLVSRAAAFDSTLPPQLFSFVFAAWFSSADPGMILALVATIALAVGWSVYLTTKVRRRTAQLRRQLDRESSIQAKYRNLVETSHDLIWSVDIDGRWTYVNPAAKRIYGYDPDEMVGRPFSEFLSADQARKDLATFDRLKQGESVFGYETVHIRKDGQPVLLTFNAMPLRDSDGTVAGSAGTACDITERKNAEVALRNSEEFLRTVINTEPECVKLVARDGTLLEMNPSGLVMIDADSLDQVKGCSVFDLAAPEHRDAFMRLTEDAFNGRSGGLEFEMIGLKGIRKWLHSRVAPMRDKDGQIIACLGVSGDITERKRAESRSAILSKLGQQLSIATSARAAARTILDAANKLFQIDAFSLDLYSDPTRNRPILNVDTVDGKQMEVPPAYTETAPSVMARKVLDEGPQLVLRKPADLSEQTLVRFGDASRPSASLMFVPVRYGTQPVGVLSVQSYSLNAYSQEDLQMLQALADHCAGALERVRAEQALRENEWQFRAMIERSMDGIMLFDAEARVTYTSPAVNLILGFTPEEQIGRNGFAQVHSDDVPAARSVWSQLLASPGQTFSMELRVAHKNGSWIWIEAKGTNLLEDPAIKSVVVNYRDVTERRSAEEALRQSEERFSKAFFSSPVAMAISTLAEGTYLLTNDRFLELLEYRADEVTGRSAIELRIWADAADRDRLVKHLREHGSVRDTEVRLRTRTGRILDALISLERILIGSQECLIANGVDVTARKVAEAAVRESEALLRQVLEALPVGVGVTDATGKFVMFNPATHRIWGGARFVGLDGYGEYRGWWHDTRQRIKADEWALARAIVRGETSLDEVIDIECFDGTRKTILNSALPIKAPDGRILGAIVMNEDITERLNLEEQLRQAQKMESVGQLAAGVAHEFNNIMTVIQGYATLMLTSPDLPKHLEQAAVEVSAGTGRAAHLTRQLLAFSRKQLMNPEALDVREVLDNLLRMLSRLVGEQVKIRFRFGSDLPAVHADRSLFEQVVLNLVINARDAMPKCGGEVVIGAEAVNLTQEQALRNPESRAGRFVCVTVGDNGCGIAPDVLPRVFEPFFTTKDIGKGTGLGLATVYGIVKQHHGWIEVESTVNVGSSFRCFLPVADRAAVHPEPRRPAPEVQGGSETILIVEDEPALLQLAQSVLKKFGYTVFKAETGTKALDVWEQHKDRIDLLLTDIVMPDGLSGYELAARLIEDKPGLRVVYSSGYTADTTGTNVQLEEGVNFLAKPYLPTALALVVRKCLDSAGTMPLKMGGTANLTVPDGNMPPN